jgi:hypothetical protein
MDQGLSSKNGESGKAPETCAEEASAGTEPRRVFPRRLSGGKANPPA